jgi:hypothetical protein
MTKLCQCCSKIYLCKEVDTKEECNKFKSWIQTKNYGEINKKNEINIEHTEKRMI